MIFTTTPPLPDLHLDWRLNRLGAFALSRMDWPQISSRRLTQLHRKLDRLASNPDGDGEAMMTAFLDFAATVLIEGQGQTGSDARTTVMNIYLVRQARRAGVMDDTALTVAISLGIAAGRLERADDDAETGALLALAAKRLPRAERARAGRAEAAKQTNAMRTAWHDAALTKAASLCRRFPARSSEQIGELVYQDATVGAPSHTQAVKMVRLWRKNGDLPKRAAA